MLKTLKWVYQLGYKHAENKLYHQIRDAISNERPDGLEMLGIEDKASYTKDELYKRLEVTRRLVEIVDYVFRPTVHESVEYFEKNRFEL